jgi:transglutaminase-like putative cysteine protease
MKEFADKFNVNETKFELFFRTVSYAAVFCGFSALWVSGSIGIAATLLFVSAVVVAWLLEGSRWQIGEKLGTTLIVLSLPVFYGIWQASPAGDGIWIAGLLARMILCLAAVKLLQHKSERDWIFLYLMTFFEVLLAAGLSISALYLVNFLVYLMLMACAIIAFEIRKTSRNVFSELSAFNGKASSSSPGPRPLIVRRIPASALAIILLTVLLAVPLFFLLPRVGGAGLGSAPRGPVSGFSDKVTLGQFGKIAEDDRIVMRVKFDALAAVTNNLYFRGIAFDTFDNKSWSRSRPEPRVIVPKYQEEPIKVGEPRGRDTLVGQTIYLEPIGTPVLFALPKPVTIRGTFDSLNVDSAGGIEHTRRTYDRISYRAFSDISLPSSTELRADRAPYTIDDVPYRSLPPSLDPRIAQLAEEIVRPFNNRYEKARAVEYYLQTKFGYTLEQKGGGKEPLADFLFNVKEGHCEYFASAMAILLRTQGIATRVVNGFHGGDYNETAGMTVVRQRHAHAWVEVYFPGENIWVTFDPTPIGGQPGDSGNASGIMGTFARYTEALEAMWIEYFVAFDDHGQQGMRRSAAGEFAKFQDTFTVALGVAHQLTSEWMTEVRGEKGVARAATTIAYLISGLIVATCLLFAVYWMVERLMRLGLFRRARAWLFPSVSARSVEFYEQLTALLAAHGLRRSASQTPLEFALATNFPEALRITEKYQNVRFGGRELTESESQEVSELIQQLKKRW